MSLSTIDPAQAKGLIDRGAILVDIREANEFARERVPGARNLPLSILGEVESVGANAVIFHCKSGMRTRTNARRLAAAAGGTAYILEGGIDAWKRAGLPVASDVAGEPRGSLWARLWR